jgi:hypothetical protein
LEVTLQDVTAGEGVLAQNTHVGAITGVCDASVNANLLYDMSFRNSRLKRWRFRCFAWR